MFVVASKMDEEGAEERKKEFDRQLGFVSYPLSSITHEGLNEILFAAKKAIDETEAFPLKGMDKADTMRVYDAHEEKEDEFRVEVDENGRFLILGDSVLLKVSLINVKTDEGMARLIRYLDRIGVEAALREAGIQEGDIVKVGDLSFTYTE